MNAFLLVAMLAQAPTPTPALDGFSVSAQGGASVSMSSTAGSLLTPIARLSVSGPLAIGSYSQEQLPVLHVDGELSALPGDTVDQTTGITGTIQQFKALEFSAGLSKRVSQWLAVGGGRVVSTSLFFEGGFATRLSTNALEPRDKAPKFACGGLRFDEGVSASYIAMGFCADQRLDGQWQPVASVKGSVAAYQFSGATGVSLFIHALLGVNLSSPAHPGLTGGSRDSIVVGTLLSWGAPAK